jgi:hypothetical protein
LGAARFATTRLILILLAITIPLAAAAPTAAAALFVPVIVTPHDLSSSLWR